VTRRPKNTLLQVPSGIYLGIYHIAHIPKAQANEATDTEGPIQAWSCILVVPRMTNPSCRSFTFMGIFEHDGIERLQSFKI
jgi:hypothetical protein